MMGYCLLEVYEKSGETDYYYHISEVESVFAYYFDEHGFQLVQVNYKLIEI